MSKFYFNECLPKTYHGTLQELFEEIIVKYVKLTKDNGNISEGIITHTLPGQLTVCDTDLGKLIRGCVDRDVRKMAFALFTKYPIDIFYPIEIFNDDELIDYRFEECDAINLIVAHKMAWFLFTLPLTDQLMGNELIVESERGEIHVSNWYGENDNYIIRILSEFLPVSERNINELIASFNGKKCVVSDGFISAYKFAKEPLQVHVIKKFKDALNAQLLFPAKHDDLIIKKCKGNGNENTYELRSRAFGGMRVYFYCDTDKIVIGGLYTKSSSEGVEQTADINRSTMIINKILADM